MNMYIHSRFYYFVLLDLHHMVRLDGMGLVWVGLGGTLRTEYMVRSN